MNREQTALGGLYMSAESELAELGGLYMSAESELAELAELAGLTGLAGLTDLPRKMRHKNEHYDFFAGQRFCNQQLALMTNNRLIIH